MRRLSLGGMRVLVTPQNPLKDANAYRPLAERLTATQQILSGLPQIRVEPEAKTGPVFAVDSLRAIVRASPGQRFVYVMGADSFAHLHRWHRWRDIMEMLPIAVVSRPGYRLSALQSYAARAFARHRVPDSAVRALGLCTAPAWGWVGGLQRPESSTEIRALENLSPSGL